MLFTSLTLIILSLNLASNSVHGEERIKVYDWPVSETEDTEKKLTDGPLPEKLDQGHDLSGPIASSNTAGSYISRSKSTTPKRPGPRFRLGEGKFTMLSKRFKTSPLNGPDPSEQKLDIDIPKDFARTLQKIEKIR